MKRIKKSWAFDLTLWFEGLMILTSLFWAAEAFSKQIEVSKKHFYHPCTEVHQKVSSLLKKKNSKNSLSAQKSPKTLTEQALSQKEFHQKVREMELNSLKTRESSISPTFKSDPFYVPAQVGILEF